MIVRTTALVLLVAAAVPLWGADEFEELLLDKFRVQNQVDVERLRGFVVDAVGKATELKEIDPDRGIELLRDATNRMDGVRLLKTAERKALNELLLPLVAELRDLSLVRRREKASSSLEAFKDYLDISAVEGRFPGRSGPGRWEPANFMTPDGQTRIGKLYSLGTAIITVRFGAKEENFATSTFPLIQVYGGFYVFDKGTGYPVFLSNREFYDSVVRPFVREYDLADVPGKARLTAAERVRPANTARLNASIVNGDLFLRGLPNPEPIPGISANDTSFFPFLAESLSQKSMPVSLDRIYSYEMQERLAGFQKIQLSAARRTLHLLQAKDAAVSPLYAEIMREETTQLLKSEYTNFTDAEVNRAILFIFSKLK